MVRVRSAIAEGLARLLDDAPVYAADEDVAARLEGFEAVRGWIRGAGPETVEVDEDGVRFVVTLGVGHKTGLYLDQRENRARVAGLAAGRDVLDAFCYTAGFACHALRGGARRAVGVESSPEGDHRRSTQPRAQRRRLARRDPVRERVRRAAPPRALGRPLRRDRARSPRPSRAADQRSRRRRGYKEINLRALRLLEPGGHLLTFSCSHHISPTLFEDICRDAAADAKVGPA